MLRFRARAPNSPDLAAANSPDLGNLAPPMRKNSRLTAMDESDVRAFIVEHMGFRGLLRPGEVPRSLCEPQTVIAKSGLGGYGVFAGAPLKRRHVVMDMCCPQRFASDDAARAELWSKGQRWDLLVSRLTTGPWVIDAGMPDLTGLLVNKALVEAKLEEPQYMWEAVDSLTDLFVFSHWAFANHSTKPNCKMLVCTEDNYNVQVQWVALRDIKEGEELTYYYGKHNQEWCELFARGQVCTGCVAPKKPQCLLGQTRKHQKELSEIAARLDGVRDFDLDKFLEDPTCA